MGKSMTKMNFRSCMTALTTSVSALALSTAVASAQSAAETYSTQLETNGQYLSGDKHNHTTCTDGAMSVRTVTRESLVTYDLDWFAQTGHGGEGPRDCRFNDPEYNGAVSGEGDFWENTIGFDAMGGDVENTSGNGAGTFFEDGDGREMWRWQSLTEYAYPMTREVGIMNGEPAWVGVETNAPGHEHVSMGIIGNQMKSNGNAYASGQFEYLFDRSDDDTSGGDANDFENPANRGVPKNTDENGDAGHAAAVASVEWLRQHYRGDSYYVPAHVERQGGFDTAGARGWNVEHFRDVHNAGLINPRRADRQSLAFGAEMIAGHQFANGGRGTYEMDRPSAGLGTYGGAGAYSAAEVTLPGMTFDGGESDLTIGTTVTTPITLPVDGAELTNAALTTLRDGFNTVFDGRLTEPSGSDQYDQLDACSDCADAAPAGVGTVTRERLVLGRPGLATMWDALLGEGRRFFNFGSSDWHNRGAFGPFEPQSTLDPWPGEYNKLYAYYRSSRAPAFDSFTAKRIVAGMRTGNTWSVMGDLIDSFTFVICQDSNCATMGEELRVTSSGGDLEWFMKLRDPAGENFSPYTFENMSLAQLGISIPTNQPVLSNVDVITGDITGVIDPADPAYTENNANQSTAIFASIDNDVAGGGAASQFTVDGEFLTATGTIDIATITNDMYFRVRGTNMPKGTPNETDADGNPLLDDFSALIPCTAVGNDDAAKVADATSTLEAGQSSFQVRNSVNAAFDPAACPDHLPVDSTGQKFLDADVEAWSDLWFYANPIFIDFRG